MFILLLILLFYPDFLSEICCGDYYISPSSSCAGQFPVTDETRVGGTVQEGVCPSAGS